MNVFKFCLVALAFLPVAVRAEVSGTFIETVIAAQRDKVAAIFMQQQRSLGDSCKDMKVLMPTTLSVFEPLELKGGKPEKGRWQVRYAVDVCKRAELRNIAMQIVNGNVALAEMVPGDTLADAELQRDVTKSFAMAGRVAMPKCTGPVVIRETKVRIFPQTKDNPWQELWIGRMCGRDLGQVVEFLPTAKGTTVKMSLPKSAQ